VNVAAGPVKFSAFASTCDRGLGAGLFGDWSDEIRVDSLRFSRQYASILHMRGQREIYARIGY
jgi:hypothetical protein